MIYPDPPVIGEQQIDNHECVPASMAAALQWCGVPTDVLTIVSWLTAHGWDTPAGVRIEGAQAYCNAAGIGVISCDDGLTPLRITTPAALGSGHPIIAFHQCDPGANPVPLGSTTIEHCRLFYGYDDAFYYTMNPWPPTLEAIPRNVMDAADENTHLTMALTVPGYTPPRRRKKRMFDVVTVNTGQGAYLIDSDGNAQALTAVPTDGSAISMEPNAFNALLAQRQKSFKDLLAAGTIKITGTLQGTLT